MISVVIADDQALVRAGFRSLLDAQQDINVVGEAANGDEAVQLALEKRPDVVLMDIRMPVVDGLVATGGSSKTNGSRMSRSSSSPRSISTSTCSRRSRWSQWVLGQRHRARRAAPRRARCRRR